MKTKQGVLKILEEINNDHYVRLKSSEQRCLLSRKNRAEEILKFQYKNLYKKYIFHLMSDKDLAADILKKLSVVGILLKQVSLAEDNDVFLWSETNDLFVRKIEENDIESFLMSKTTKWKTTSGYLS